MTLPENQHPDGPAGYPSHERMDDLYAKYVDKKVRFTKNGKEYTGVVMGVSPSFNHKDDEWLVVHCGTQIGTVHVLVVDVTVI